MRLTDKTEHWNYGKVLIGRKKKYEVRIEHAAHPIPKSPYWYFVLSKEEFRYNSLWDNIKFKTQEECVSAAEEKIEELEKAKNV